jgi:D-alanyl-D-alanine dipeptidase
LVERRKDFIAAPLLNPSAPSPHLAGDFDVTLRWRPVEPSLRYVPGKHLWLGYEDGRVGDWYYPDYYERLEKVEGRDEEARRNRRAFYAIMTGAALEQPTGLAVNPTEIFHWGRGTQLWALVSGAAKAYYGAAPLP